MGTKIKWFEDKDKSASKLWADVGQNNVKTYDVDDYLNRFTLPVHTEGAAEKWTGITVAVSGEAVTGNDWLVAVPYRLDEAVDQNSGTKKKVYDLDPTIMVLDTDTGTPHPSGAAAYHQKFTGRTTDVGELDNEPMDVAVSGLRDKLTTGVAPLESAPPEVLSALHFMHQKFGPSFDS